VWPTLDLAFAIGAMRLAMLAIVAGAAAWAMYVVYKRLLQPRDQPSKNIAVEG